jgi:hypothetical protein
VIGLIYSMIAAVIRLLGDRSTFDNLGITFLSALQLYLGTGIFGGVGAAFFPGLRQTRLGRALLGTLIVLPLALGLTLARAHEIADGWRVAGSALVLSVIAIASLLSLIIGGGIVAQLISALPAEPDFQSSPRQLPGGEAPPEHRRRLGGS